MVMHRTILVYIYLNRNIAQLTHATSSSTHPLSRIWYYAHTQGMRLSLGMLHSKYLCFPIRADLFYDILVGTANFGAKALKKEYRGTGIELIKC
jgi:hypothetical protein